MEQALSGFFIIFAVIAVGFVLGKLKSLGPEGQRVLSSLVFLVATPCLLFDKIVHTNPAQVFSGYLWIIAASSLSIGALFFLISRLFLHRSYAESLVGMLSASYANGGNLGIPLAAYLIGDTSVVVPLMLFQIAFYAPLSTSLLDIARSGNAAGWKSNLRMVLKNPMFIASLCGIIVAAWGISIPELITQPIHILGNSSVPLALVVFGMSLSEARILAPGSHRLDVFLAALLKNIAHPLLCVALGSCLWGMQGTSLFAIAVLGALPTAQNVYTYAVRFNVGQDQARDTGLVSTIVSVPVIIAITFLAH